MRPALVLATSIAIVAALVACAPSTPIAHASSPRTSAECARCHDREARAWHTSAHARAATTPVFTLSLKTATHRAWCLGCHAPSGVDDGVACVDCHATHAKPAADACDRCHEFKQPRLDERRFVAGPFFAQATATEHASSSFAKTACAECHMRGGDHATPSLIGTGLSIERVAVSVHDVDGAGPDDDAIAGTAHVELRATGVGHRAPTGDPFRRLEVVLCADDACTTLAGRRVLGRRTEARPEGFAFVADTTLPPPRDGALTSDVALDVTLHAVPVRVRLVEKLVDADLENDVDFALRQVVLVDRPLP